jgi:EAP30/Vps36 family
MRISLIDIREDMRKAVDTLHKLGNDFKIINAGNKRVICSVSVELSQDNLLLMQVAETNKGWVTFS